MATGWARGVRKNRERKPPGALGASDYVMVMATVAVRTGDPLYGLAFRITV
jgi:hypothetical protein